MDYLTFGAVFGVICAIIAGSKGRSTGGWFLLGFLFSLIALVVLVLLSSIKKPDTVAGHEIASPETHVRCPDCRELVRADARRCKHCGITLTPQNLT